MEEGPAIKALVALAAARDAVAALDIDALPPSELLEMLDHLERDTRRAPVVTHRIVNRLAAEVNPLEFGATSLGKLFAFALRTSQPEARRRIDSAADLGPRRALSGEPLAPLLVKTAAAQARGLINEDHVTIIRGFFARLPDAVDHETREAAEVDLARIASEHSPEGLRKAANLLLALLHPDGDLCDEDRQRRRGVTMGPQQSDGMSRLGGWLTPEARATWEAVFAKAAAPGSSNPEDHQSPAEGQPRQQDAERDLRSAAQRNHDALLAIGRMALSSGELGRHNGLPVTVIVSTTLQELESGAGQALTAGGSRLPMRDLIRLASRAHHYLAVFDKHTNETLYLGRTRRCASAAQRIALLAKHRGCTRPGCLASGYACQAHHAVADWKNDGQTNVDDLTLACGPDNRLIENTTWTTRRRPDGRTEWIPPPQLDTGQARINELHHPEHLLCP